MKKKIAFLLAAVMALSVFSFTGCSSGNSGGSGSTASTSSALTIKDNVLMVGVDNTYPPMEFVDDKGNLVGFEVDMANDIATKMGYTIEWVPTAFDGIFAALDAGKYDCIISSISMTSDRLQNYEFTAPYCANAQMIVVKKGDTSIKAASDLSGKNVGCQKGTTAEDSANYLINTDKINFNLTTYDSVESPFDDLKIGRIEAVVVDEVVGQYYIKQFPDKFQSAAVNLTNEPIGICFKKGNYTLRINVQTAIDALYADGTMKSLSQKWFGSDLTSNINTKLQTLG